MAQQHVELSRHLITRWRKRTPRSEEEHSLESIVRDGRFAMGKIVLVHKRVCIR